MNRIAQLFGALLLAAFILFVFYDILVLDAKVALILWDWFKKAVDQVVAWLIMLSNILREYQWKG